MSNYFDIPSNNQIIVHEKTGEEIGTVTVDATTTFENLFAALAEYDIDGQIHDGKVMFDSNRELYVTGDVIEEMGMQTEYTTVTTTTTVGKSQTTAEKTFNVTDVADNDSVINDFVNISGSNNQIVVKDIDGNPTATVTVSSTQTFGDLFNTLAPLGVTGDMNGGVLTLVHNDGGYVDGSFTTAIGMSTKYTTVVTTTTVGGTQTTSAKTFSITDIADYNSKINNFLTITDSNNQLVVKDIDGNITGSVTITNTMTFNDLFAELVPLGVDGDIQDGRVTFLDNNGGYVDGSFAAAMGISTTYTTVTTTTTVGGTQTTASKTFSSTDIADYNSVINNFLTISSSNNQLVVKDIDGNATGTVTVTNTMTFNDLFAALVPLGVDGDIQDGRVTFLDNNGGYVDGSFAAAMGISTTYTTVTTTTTVGGTQTTASKTFSSTDIADYNSVINNFLTISNSNNQLVVKDIDGNATGTVTVTNTMTFNDLFAALVPLGVDGDIQDGRVTMLHNNGGYVDGSFAAAMGIGTTYKTVTTTTTVGGTQTTASKTFSSTDVADYNSVINNFITISSSNNKLVVKDVNGTATGTVTVTNTMTFNDLFAALSPLGVDGDIQDGRVTFLDNYGGYVDGTFATALGITTTYKTVTSVTTVGTTKTGGAKTYTVTYDATGSNTFKEIGSGGNKTYYIVNGQSGATIKAGTFTESTTIGQFADILGQYGFSASIDGGYFTASSPQGMYVKGTAADALGLTTYTYTQTVHGTATNVISATDTQVVNQTRTLDVASTGLVTVTAKDTIVIDVTKTQTVASTGLVTVNAKQTLTVNISQTLNVASSGYVTVSAKQTVVVDQTRTISTNSSGYATINVTRTINVAQTLNVTTTGAKTITTTIVTKFTVSQNATGTATITIPTTNVTPVTSTPNGSTKLSDAGILTSGSAEIRIRTTNYASSQNYATGDANIGKKVTIYSTDTIDQAIAKINATEESCTNVNWGVADTATGVTKMRMHAEYSTSSGVFSVKVQLLKGSSWVDADTYENSSGGWNSNGYGSCLGIYGADAFSTTSASYDRLSGDNGNYTGAYYSRFSYNVPKITTYQTTTGTRTQTITTGATINRTITTTSTATQTVTITSAGTTTVNVSRTITIAQTVAVNTTGTATINIKQTLTINATQTAAVNTTGLTTVNVTRVYTISATQTATVNTTGYTTVNIKQTRTVTATQTTNVAVTGKTTVNICQTLKITAHQTITVDTTSTRTVTANKSSADKNVYSVAYNMDGNTKLSQVGLGAGTITVVHKGTSSVISLAASDTIDSVIGRLGAYGIEAYVSAAGAMTFKGTTDGYITGATGSAATLGATAAYTTTSATAVLGTNSAGARKTRSVTNYMNSDTTLAQLGWAAGTVTGVEGGQAFTVSVGTNNSIGDLLTALAGYNISGVISSDGKLTLKGSFNGYITGATGGLSTGLGIGQSTVKTTQTVVNGTNSAGARKTRNITKTMNSDTTLAQLGLAAGTVKGMHEGKAFTVSMGTNNSIGDLISALAGYGISGVVSSAGKLTLTGSADGYITEATGGLLNGLGIGVSTVKSTSTVVQGINTAANRKTRTITKTMNSDTTLAQLGWAAGTVKGMHEGKAFTVSMGTNNSIGDLISALAGYGISGMISSDGKLTLTGSADGYITEATGGLKDNLGIVKSTVKSTKTVVNGINSAADRKTRSITQTMNSDTTLADFGWAAGTVKGYYQGQAFTITMQTNNTIGDLISALAARGIAGTISNTGKLTLTGSADGYITSATGGLLDGLGVGVSTVKSTTTVVNGINSAADRKTRTITNYMDSDTTLAQLGWAAGTVTGYHEGKAFTVSMGTNNSIGDLISALAGYGVSGMISSDGKLTLTGSADGYITAATGGLKDNLGIVKSTVKSTKTVVNGINSAADRKTRSITQTMNSDTTLADFGWAAGSVKGYYQGEAFTISMQTNNSIGDLISALAARGIAGTISNAGKLTLTGSADGYITEATGGLADSLGIVTSTVKSTSTVVNGVTSAADSKSRTIIHTMDADTTFADLGLAAGTAKVNYQGKDYTISMNANNTMNDFMTALAGYGISSVIKDGKMTVQGTTDGFVLSTTGGVKDLGIKTSTLKTTTTTVTGDNGLSTTLIKTTDPIMNRSTLLSDLQDADGNNLGITTGSYYIYQNGVRRTQTITEDMTVNDLMSQVAEYGLIADIAENGEIALNGHGNSYMATSAIGGTKNSNIVEKLFAEWDFTKIYDSNNLSIPTPVVQAITKDTKLDNISSSQEFKEGIITIFKDGIKTNLYVNKEDTVGTFMDELAMHGFNSVINDKGQLIVKTDGNSNLQNYSNSSVSSNVLDILGLNSNNWISTSSYQSKEENVITYHDEYIDAKEDTVLASIKKNSTLESINGNIEMTVDGVKNIVSVNENETVGSLLGKFRDLGLEATISNGQILIQSGYKDIEINEAGTTSALGRSNTSIGLSYFNDLGGYASSDAEVISTTYENKDISVSNWADLNTNLSMLNITSGTFSVYENGQKAVINITSDDTFATLQAKIQNKLNDVKVSFDNGYLTFTSNSGGKVTTGSSTDTSNLSSITGLSATGNKTVSARELYKVNAETSLIGDGLFREDNIYEGTFTIGEEEFTIDSTTTLNDVMNMINSSENSGATAYWDSVGGKLVLNSRSTGSMFVNVEKGTSNFTDVMGLTSTKNGVSRMNIEAQQVGTNAEFTIDGTTYTSNSNTITSDISRIKGVTLQLKSISQDEETASTKEETLSVEKDRETLSNAIEDVLDSYNELMTNVDKSIAAGGDLSDQTTLKMIRNQLRSLMTSSILDANAFKNVDAIGISVEKATGSNISTSGLTTLTFNKDKFYQAYNSDPLAVKSLLIGTDTSKGILTRIEDLVESTLTGVTGYFDTQNNSYMKQIQQINDRISKENRSNSRYQEILESKFSAMDLLISQMQQQYSSFLSS